MPRYLFEVVLNDERSLGDTLVDLADLGDMRREALKALQDIAIDEIVANDKVQTLTVSVRDENGWPVYSATLTMSETWGSDGNAAVSH